MSQNPFGPPAMHDPFAAPPQPVRTSALAITALIFSIIPCTGVIGVILGIIAMITIGGSQGRVKGRGMAVTAVILGLITSVLLIGGCVVAVKSQIQQKAQVDQPTFRALTALESGDASQFRALLSPTVAATYTDDDLLAFRDAYVAQLGAVKGDPQGAEALGLISAMDPMLQGSLNTSGVKGVVPVATSFANRATMMFVASDSVPGQMAYAFGNPTFKGSVVDLGIVVPGGKSIKLSDYKGKGTTSKPADSAPPAGGNGG